MVQINNIFYFLFSKMKIPEQLWNCHFALISLNFRMHALLLNRTYYM